MARTRRADDRRDDRLTGREAERILDGCLGRPVKRSGARVLWNCPRCGEPKLSMKAEGGTVGCLNDACPVPGETDAGGMAAYLKDLGNGADDRGRSHDAYTYDPAARGPVTRRGDEQPDGIRDVLKFRREGGAQENTVGGNLGDHYGRGGSARYDALPEAFERWYALSEGEEGAVERIGKPPAYRPEGAQGIELPPDCFVTEGELGWAALWGFAAAAVTWFVLAANRPLVEVPFLPTPPPALVAIGEVPTALLFGCVVAFAVAMHLRGRREALRRHLTGEDLKG